MSFFLHPQFKSRKQRITIYGLILLEVVAISFIIPSSSSTGEITPSVKTPTGPIQYISTVFQNVTVATQSLSFLVTPFWTTSQNETMIVVASSQNTFSSTIVSAVTDILGDTFTKVIAEHVPPPSGEPTDLEIWIGKDSPLKSNSVTVTWNNTNFNSNMIQVELYQNIATIGQSVGQATNFPYNPSLSITTAKSGVWMFGAVAVQSIPGSPATTPCPGQIASESTGFITRSKGCSTPDNTDGVETWASDNNTSLRNGITVTYAITVNPVFVPSELAQVEIELLPVDLEPQHQDINLSLLCATTGDTCHINSVNKVSGINTLQTLAPNTAYCTGITTTALTTTSTQLLNVLATYSALSANVTGAKLLIQVYVTSSAPSTSFGVGLCAGSSSVTSPGVIYFQTSGVNGQYNVNYYSTSMIGVISEVAGTYYSFIEITPQNFVGHISMAQWGVSPNSQLTMYEVK